jgi:hypothetical protein
LNESWPKDEGNLICPASAYVQFSEASLQTIYTERQPVYPSQTDLVTTVRGQPSQRAVEPFHFMASVSPPTSEMIELVAHD